jgi:hypothetical protein
MLPSLVVRFQTHFFTPAPYLLCKTTCTQESVPGTYTHTLFVIVTGCRTSEHVHCRHHIICTSNPAPLLSDVPPGFSKPAVVILTAVQRTLSAATSSLSLGCTCGHRSSRTKHQNIARRQPAACNDCLRTLQSCDTLSASR